MKGIIIITFQVTKFAVVFTHHKHFERALYSYFLIPKLCKYLKSGDCLQNLPITSWFASSQSSLKSVLFNRVESLHLCEMF